VLQAFCVAPLGGQAGGTGGRTRWIGACAQIDESMRPDEGLPPWTTFETAFHPEPKEEGPDDFEILLDTAILRNRRFEVMTRTGLLASPCGPRVPVGRTNPWLDLPITEQKQ
jgi:hypothetical protein